MENAVTSTPNAAIARISFSMNRAPGVMGVLFEGRAYDNGTADAYLGSVAEYATRQRRV